MDSEDNEPSAIGTPERHEPPPRMPRHSSDDDAFSFREAPRLATVPEGGPLGSAPQQQVSSDFKHHEICLAQQCEWSSTVSQKLVHNDTF